MVTLVKTSNLDISRHISPTPWATEKTVTQNEKKHKNKPHKKKLKNKEERH